MWVGILLVLRFVLILFAFLFIGFFLFSYIDEAVYGKRKIIINKKGFIHSIYTAVYEKIKILTKKGKQRKQVIKGFLITKKNKRR